MSRYAVPCPQDASHGGLLDWSGDWSWYCPHRAHTGRRFYHFDEPLPVSAHGGSSSSVRRAQTPAAVRPSLTGGG